MFCHRCNKEMKSYNDLWHFHSCDALTIHYGNEKDYGKSYRFSSPLIDKVCLLHLDSTGNCQLTIRWLPSSADYFHLCNDCMDNLIKIILLEERPAYSERYRIIKRLLDLPEGTRLDTCIADGIRWGK